jgi:limonene-1,2-epoxide hydrolase
MASPRDETPASTPTDAPTEPVEVVRAFLGALERVDVEAALALTADDIVYQNVPLPPARGRAEFEKQMRFLERYCTGFEAEIHHVAADGTSVLTERTDALMRNDFRAAFWVDGTFEVVDGRITEWRDRFDWVTVVVAVLAAVPRALLSALSRR